MAFNCRHCGAPLPVQSQTGVIQCLFCGNENAAPSAAAPAPAPAADRVPSDASPSDEESSDRVSGKSSIGCVVLVIGILLVVAMSIGVTLWPAVSRTDPSKLKQVTLSESPRRILDVLGGQLYDKSLRVELKKPYDSLVLVYNTVGVVESLALNFPEGMGCTVQHNRIRRRLADHLGPRFDRASWRFGGAQLNVQEDCSTVSLSFSSDANASEELRGALWTIMKADVLGLPVTMDDTSLNNAIGRGSASQPEQVGKLIASMTIEEAMMDLTKKLPGVETTNRTDYEIPCESRLFKAVRVEWKNSRNGGIHGLLFRAVRDHGLGPEALTACFAKQTGATYRSHVDNYAQQKVSYYFNIRKAAGDVHSNSKGINPVQNDDGEVTGSVDSDVIVLSATHYSEIPPDTVIAIFNAVAACGR